MTDTFDDIVEQFKTSEPKFFEHEPDEPVEGHQEEDEEYEEVDNQEEAQEEGQEDGQGDDEEDPQGEDPGSDNDDPNTGEEDPETEITLGEETHKVKLSELKQLYTQKQDIEAKATGLQQTNRIVESQGLFLANLYNQRLQAAQTNAAKYAKVDLFTAYRELEPEEFETLKAAKEAADAELKTVAVEAQNFMQNVEKTKREYLREQARHSIGIIREKIPEWSDELYGKIRTYAVAQGLTPEVANEIVDAPAIVMMHKAMLYDAAKSKSAEVKQKVLKAPKKVAKKGDSKINSETASKKRLINIARESGDIDDVAAAFLAAHRA